MKRKQLREDGIFLKAIAKATPKLQRQMILALPDEQIKHICEILHNILKDTIKIKRQQKDQLIKYKHGVRLLGMGPFKPLNRKRKILSNQKGGFIGAVLPIIASILAANV